MIKLEPSDGSVVATVKVLDNCRLGEHVAQVRTATGVSEYRTFYIGPYGPTEEKEPNSEFTAPQPITLNTTVNGVVQNEDVDYYSIEVKKGQRIAVEVEGMRLGTALFDPYQMRLKIGKLVDLIVDGGACGLEPTTMIDLVEGVPQVVRVGKGDPEPFR